MQDSKEENYKEMYLIMFRACEEAIDTLITASGKGGKCNWPQATRRINRPRKISTGPAVPPGMAGYFLFIINS